MGIMEFTLRVKEEKRLDWWEDNGRQSLQVTAMENGTPTTGQNPDFIDLYLGPNNVNPCPTRVGGIHDNKNG